jgi:hypothetical protein
MRCGRASVARRCRSTARSAAFNASMARRRDSSRPGDVAISPVSGPLSLDVDATPDIDVVELAELPMLLTIRQAAKVLDVCSAKAYAMAHRYEETGCEGLPVIRLDKLYRVPRGPFAVLVLTGRVVTVVELEAHAQHVHEQLSDRRVAVPNESVVEPEAGSRSRSAGRRAAGRVGRTSGRRRVGSVEQLRLLPGE